MIEFLCLPHAAPFCATAEYAATVHIGSLDYQGGFWDRAIPPDPDARVRLGADVTFGFPDVGRSVDPSAVREVCQEDRCVRFVVDCADVAETCIWEIVRERDDGTYSKFSFVSVQATSPAQMTAATQNLALDLGGGVHVPLASLIDAPRVSATIP